MATLTNATFVGYAYYSVRGEGFIYTLSSNKDSNSSGSPMTILNVVVDSAAKANNFTSLLLLVVGSALMVGLIALVILSFFCQRKVPQLEKTYWKLQDTFTDVNDTLFQEIKRCTPPAAAIPSPSTQHKHTHPFQAQLAANTPSLPLLMQPGSICTSNVTPVRQLQQQRNPRPYDMNANLFPAAAPTVVHTENAYHHYFASQGTHTPASFFVTHTPPLSAPHLQEQQRVSGRFSESRSSSAPPEQSPLRRRMSKVSFIGA
ncbi:hypothetical protein JKF63_07217 [Porcisia hertigi]|uniref:Uncharacterized protein n=1 Tax=Porcisia hertigi TaxID=2761500 RepID=A0A837A958_9TRYP|nr:hypothetical protein JKF63_07217 [Porcisia hertigi]